MFVQHHPSHSISSTVALNAKEDFDLIIESSRSNTLKGKITFTYLHQFFEATIMLSPNSIEVHSLYPYEGIQAAAPILDEATLSEKSYVHNGSITHQGKQNIVWLILDVIHLYNIVRLKPTALLTIYRATFNQIKNQSASDLIFGKIPLNQPVAKKFANQLAEEARRKFKYVYGNSLHLLASVQQIIATYPQPFVFIQPVTTGQSLVNPTY